MDLFKVNGQRQNIFLLKSKSIFIIFSLSMDKKLKTDLILDPHYSTNEKFSFPKAFVEPDVKFPRTKYKHYSQFTKSFDKITYK